MAITVAALRFRQKQELVNLYLTVLPAGQLVGQCQVDYYREDNPRGYQRPLARSRLKQVAAFIKEEEGMLPISVLLCIRQPDRAEFIPAAGDGASPGSGERGTLTIPDNVSLWVVDGQHRLFGLQHAIKRGRMPWVKEYPLPVTIVEGINSYDEMRYFHVINTRQKGVPTDVVDRHLFTMREVEGMALLDREGERNYLRGRATKLCDLLQQSPESPWQGRIRMAGEPAKPEHLIRQHTVVASLEPALKDSFLSRLSDEEAGKVLLNFWAAVAQRWPMAVKEPKDYYLLKTMGLYALHMVFPDLVQLCRETNSFSADRMYDLLIETGVSVGFWHKSHGHPMVKEIGARYIRAVGEYLRERLPKLAVPRI